MITDERVLAGATAYLRGPGGPNLAGQPLPVTGTHAGILQDAAWELTGISLYLEADELASLFRWHDEPLFEIVVEKEMFPELFRDPYATRVHSVAGFDDLRRGQPKGMEVLDIDGVATLVSASGGPCGWMSTVYRLAAPIAVTGCAWDLALSRLAPKNALSYTLELAVWRSAAAGGQPDQVVAVAQNRTVQDPRAKPNLALERVHAYQLRLRAESRIDGALWERYGQGRGFDTLGQPILSAVYLAEPVQSPFSFFSLSELVDASAEWRMVGGEAAPKSLHAALVLPATLIEKESIALVLRSAAFRRLEAKLRGREYLRPPRSEREP